MSGVPRRPGLCSRDVRARPFMSGLVPPLLGPLALITGIPSKQRHSCCKLVDQCFKVNPPPSTKGNFSSVPE